MIFVGAIKNLKELCDEGFAIGLVLSFESRRYTYDNSTKTVDFVSVSTDSLSEYDKRKFDALNPSVADVVSEVEVDVIESSIPRLDD